MLPGGTIHLNGLSGIVGAICLLLCGACSDSDSRKDLHLLTYVTFAHPDIVQDWEHVTGCNVKATLVGSNDEIIAKIALGANYDLVSASFDLSTVFWKMDRFVPLERDRLTEFHGIFERFQQHPSVTMQDGRILSQPVTWGAIPYMYRSDLVSPPPTSVKAFFDGTYSGKIAMWDDKTTIYIVARMLFGNDINVFDLTDEQLDAVKEKLIEQKKDVRSYWTQPGDHINLLASGEAWLSNTWSGYQVAELNARGLPFVEFIPEERADGFVDAFMLMKGAENIDCAYQYLNFVASAEGQCKIVKWSGLSGVNPSGLRACLTPDRFSALHLDNPGYLDNLVLHREPERLDALTDTWNAVKISNPD